MSSGLVIGHSTCHLGVHPLVVCRPRIRCVVSFPVMVVWTRWRSSALVTWHLRPRFGWLGAMAVGCVSCRACLRCVVLPSSCHPGLLCVVWVFVVSFAALSLGGAGICPAWVVLCHSPRIRRVPWVFGVSSPRSSYGVIPGGGRLDLLALVNLGDVAPVPCPFCGHQ
jgi:hypothetical protein